MGGQVVAQIAGNMAVVENLLQNIKRYGGMLHWEK